MISSDNQPKIFIVDDDMAVRNSLQLMLEQEGMIVETYDGAEAFLKLNLHDCIGGCCACAIIDMHMPGINGLELQAILSKMGLPLPIIFLTGYGDISTSVKAVKAGAQDFLTKPVSLKILLTSIQSAMQAGEVMYKQIERRRAAKARLEVLTVREREIMALSVAGVSNKDIARQLDISYRTVEHHKSSILRKTGASNLLDLAGIAQESEPPFIN